MVAKARFVAAVLLAAVGYGPATRAASNFSRMPSIGGGFASDRDVDTDGAQQADDFTPGTSTTARGVTWRGLMSAPDFPVTFDRYLYAGNGSNPPDPASVLSTTAVSFASAAGITHVGGNVYKFRAAIAPAALAATRRTGSPRSPTPPTTRTSISPGPPAPRAPRRRSATT